MEQDGDLTVVDAPGTPPSLVVGAAQAARLCGIGRATWYSLQRAGRLPKPVRLGGRVLWRPDELRAWVDAGCPSLARWESMKRGRWS
jgi:predicted DNA-binding transcriptional regulator AlpA